MSPPEKSLDSKIFYLLVFICVGLLGGAYDVFQDEFLHTQLTHWQSHLITMGVSGCVAVLLATLIRHRTQKATEQILAMQQLQDETESLNQSQTLFLQTMAHELRTPLNGVIGMSDLIQTTDLDATQQKMASVIHDNALQLLAHINNILFFIRAQDRSLKASFNDFDPAKLLETVTREWEEKVQKKGLTLRYTFSAPTLILHTDSSLLKKVLYLLMDNAVNFTREGEIELSGELEHQTFIIRVRDTGCGMSEETQRQIFQPFFQADRSLTRVYGGIGLGLALAKHLIGTLGGKIDVESIPEQGSCFSLSFPLPSCLEQPSQT